MAKRLLLSYLLLIFAALTSAKPATNIEGTLRYSNKSPFNETALIHLNYGEIETYAQADGSFTLYDVPPGVHVLTVHNPKYHFAQVKIQLLEDDMQNPKCIEYAYPGAPKNPVLYPLVLTTLGKYEYFEKKPGFTILAILKNPMFLMMAFMAGMMYMMPKMMEGLDPEERAQMKKQMEMQQDPTKMIGSLFGMGEEEKESPKKSKKNK